MKRACCVLLILVATGVLGAVADPEPDVDNYGFGQVAKNTQTDASTVTPNANPYSFQVFVGGDGAHITTATLDVPGPNAATYNVAGDPDFTFGTSYQYSGTSSPSLLDSVFPRSAGYVLKFKTPANPTSGYTISSLDLTGGVFPSVTPQVAGGGTWSSGSLVVDVTNEANYLTFSSFTGMNEGTDFIIFDLWSTTDYHALTSSTQFNGSNFYIGPDTQTHVPYLTAGDIYQASITFLKVIDTDTSSVPTLGNEQGYSFMATRTYFTVQAVPEPSTYALLALGLGLLGFRHRRRAG